MIGLEEEEEVLEEEEEEMVWFGGRLANVLVSLRGL